ncbi:MAG: RNA polymerase sigma-70 factor [Chitinophagaceae bacterium]|nr:RNA polymerase sigma-70 factor [Chitinophagaceae bacterium]
MPPYTEREMLRMLADGDEAAFEQFYNTYWNNIYSIALAYMKSPQLAQDIVQDVFLRVWDNRVKFASINDPAAFIYIMGRNTVINALKKKMSLAGLEKTQHYIPDDFMLPNQNIELKQLQERIESIVSQLPPQQILVIKLSREEGLSHKEIADRLGIEKTTVKNHIVRALNTIRNRLSFKENLLVIWCLLAQWFTGN